MGIRLLHKNQRGITLIELMIAVALAGIITGGITATIMQVLTINTRASNHMVALRQVQQAGKEVSKDVLQAKSVVAGGIWDFSLSVTWEDYETEDLHEVTYTITADNKLRRSLTITPVEGDPAPPIVSTIAEYIDVTIDLATGKPKTYCDWDPDGKVLTFKVTATVGTRSETRTYEIEPRPGPL